MVMKFTFGVKGPDVLFFEVHLDARVFQVSHGGEGVDRVAGEAETLLVTIRSI